MWALGQAGVTAEILRRARRSMRGFSPLSRMLAVGGLDGREKGAADLRLWNIALGAGFGYSHQLWLSGGAGSVHEMRESSCSS